MRMLLVILAFLHLTESSALEIMAGPDSARIGISVDSSGDIRPHYPDGRDYRPDRETRSDTRLHETRVELSLWRGERKSAPSGEPAVARDKPLTRETDNRTRSDRIDNERDRPPSVEMNKSEEQFSKSYYGLKKFKEEVDKELSDLKSEVAAWTGKSDLAEGNLLKSIDLASVSHNSRIQLILDNVNTILIPGEVDVSGFNLQTPENTPEYVRIKRTINYYHYVKSELDSSEMSDSEVKQTLLEIANSGIVIADGFYSGGEEASGDEALDFAKNVLDVALSFAPVVGWGKDMYEAATGRNLVTGEVLDDFERAAAVLGVVTVGFGSKIMKGLSTLRKVKLRHMNVLSWNKALDGAGNIAKSAKKSGFTKGEDVAQLAKGWKSVTPDMESKILYGARKSPNKNQLIGAHSPNVKNNPNFEVEVLNVNPDGTQNVKLIKGYPDGSVSKIKSSTLFPDSWPDEKITNATRYVGQNPKIATRATDGATLHKGKVDGVEMDVIKKGDEVISGYPTGGSGGIDPSTF